MRGQDRYTGDDLGLLQFQSGDIHLQPYARRGSLVFFLSDFRVVCIFLELTFRVRVGFFVGLV